MDVKKVELRAAFEWTCPECGSDRFERGITLEREQVAAMVPEGRREDVDATEGQWLMPPDAVTCDRCGRVFGVETGTDGEG